MDFRQASQVSNNRAESTTQPTVAGEPSGNGSFKSFVKGKGKGHKSWALLTVLKVVVLVGAALLLLATTLAVVRGNGSSEKSLVATSNYQAVFLNNGQVYFGKVQEVNTRFINLTDVYYLTQSTSGEGQATGDYTLVKLGCQQIHYPEDQMVITREQVTFWENLNANGKVTKSIADFKKQYPNGPNCEEQTSQTPATGTPSQSSNNAGANTQTNNSTSTGTRPSDNN